jgi:hypothetical protein
VRIHHQACSVLSLAIAVAATAGCGTTSYRMVKTEAVQPVAPMDLKVATANVELTLTGLIIYDGPGAWKQKAYWDEYIVRMENHSATPVLIESFALGDVLDRKVLPGADPWALEKTGRKHELYLQARGVPADPFACAHRRQRTAGNAAGGALIAGAAATPVVMPAMIYGWTIAMTAYSPVWVANKAFVDPKNRQLILAEFNRHRLVLPLQLEPGASVTGSLFFPLTPGPEHLQVSGSAEGKPWELSLKLPMLAGLHFTYVPEKHYVKAARPPGILYGIPRPVPKRQETPVIGDSRR